MNLFNMKRIKSWNRAELTLFWYSNAESPEEEVQQGEAPPTEESNVHMDADSQSQPTEETTSTGRRASSITPTAITRELKRVN